MSTDPTFESVDNYTSDLLDLVADEHPATPSERDEWETFTRALEEAADATGVVNQNDVRPRLRGRIAPRRIGAFYHRAASQGLIVPDGWVVSDDREGRNSGRPTRLYRWTGQRRRTAGPAPGPVLQR